MSGTNIRPGSADRDEDVAAYTDSEGARVGNAPDSGNAGDERPVQPTVPSDAPSAAQTPELVKLAARAMLNDPESVSGELVRAWKALRAENALLRDALTQVKAAPLATDDAQRIAEEALSRV